MSRQDASARKIQAADLASKRKPTAGIGDEIRIQHVLHQPHTRVAAVPEPVVVPAMVNGRPLEPWEAGLYVAWAHGERRRELAMFGGLIS